VETPLLTAHCAGEWVPFNLNLVSRKKNQFSIDKNKTKNIFVVKQKTLTS